MAFAILEIVQLDHAARTTLIRAIFLIKIGLNRLVRHPTLEICKYAFRENLKISYALLSFHRK